MGAPAACARPCGVKLPTSALMRSGEDTSVWVFDPATDGAAPPVVVITADGNDVVVAGLEPGEEVVAAGRACAVSRVRR
jgi:hypothetical protein